MENTFKISGFFLIFILFAIHTVCIIYLSNKINSTDDYYKQEELLFIMFIEVILIGLSLTLVML